MVAFPVVLAAMVGVLIGFGLLVILRCGSGENLMIEAKVTNPQDIKLAITIELSLGEWREIKKRVSDAMNSGASLSYYAPVSDLLQGIGRAIGMVQDRAQINDSVPVASPEGR